MGVYHVVSRLPKDKLTDFYGSGAYPLSYPNEWDLMRGRDGRTSASAFPTANIVNAGFSWRF